MVKEDTIIHDIILQLIRVSPTLDSNLREEQIRFLTPIEIVHTSGDERAFTFYVGKQSPKDSKRIVEDLITPIESEELYPFYMELPQEEFVIRLNKTLYDYVRQQLEQAKASHVPDSDNIWMQPNAEFYNWFQEKGIDSIPSFFDIMFFLDKVVLVATIPSSLYFKETSIISLS